MNSILRVDIEENLNTVYSPMFECNSDPIEIKIAINILTLDISPNGQHIVVGVQQSLKIYDLETLQQVGQLIGELDDIYAVKYSPNGQLLASGSVVFQETNSCLCIWDSKDQTQVMNLKGHIVCVLSLAFSPNGKNLVSGSIYGSVILWDLQNESSLEQLEQRPIGNIYSISYSPDGAFIVTGASDSIIRLLDSNNLTLLKTYQGHGDCVLSLEYYPNGLLLSGSEDKLIKIWRMNTAKTMTLYGHQESVHSVAFSTNSHLILSGSQDSTTRIWSTKSRKQVRVFRFQQNDVQSVKFSQDSTYFVSAGNHGSLWISNIHLQKRTRL